MAYGRYRRWRRRSRFYRRRRWKRRPRMVNASSRSSVRVKCPVRILGTLTVPTGTQWSDVASFTALWSNNTHSGNATNALRGGVYLSPTWLAYQRLYDQWKLDGMGVKFTLTTPIGADGELNSCSLYTAWDRKLQAPDFAAVWDPNTKTGYPTAVALSTMPTYQPVTAINHSITKIKRYIAASDLLERISFIDSDFSSRDRNVNGVTQNVSVCDDTLPAFCPCLFLALSTDGIVSAVSDRQVNYIAEITFYCTFRNPKYGASTSSSKAVTEVIDEMDPPRVNRGLQYERMDDPILNLDDGAPPPDDDPGPAGDGPARPSASVARRMVDEAVDMAQDEVDRLAAVALRRPAATGDLERSVRQRVENLGGLIPTESTSSALLNS